MSAEMMAAATPLVSTSILAGLEVSISNIPPREWLYGLHLLRGEITVIAAPGGVGKSSLAIGMSVALASGRNLLGEKIWDGPHKVLYINGQDDHEEFERRVHAFDLKHGVAKQDLDRLIVYGSDDWETQQISLLRTGQESRSLDQADIDHLTGLLLHHRPDLLVLDPLIIFSGGGNVHHDGMIALVMMQLKRMARKFDCAIMIVHHTTDGCPLSSVDIRGVSTMAPRRHPCCHRGFPVGNPRVVPRICHQPPVSLSSVSRGSAELA